MGLNLAASGWRGLLAVLALLAACSPTPAQVQGPAEVVQAYVSAFAAGNQNTVAELTCLQAQSELQNPAAILSALGVRTGGLLPNLKVTLGIDQLAYAVAREDESSADVRVHGTLHVGTGPVSRDQEHDAVVGVLKENGRWLVCWTPRTPTPAPPAAAPPTRPAATPTARPLVSSAPAVTSGTLLTARVAHSATLLANGKVLVAGGAAEPRLSAPTSNAVELFDPATGGSTPTGSMRQPRAYHDALLLKSGNVLVIGGFSPMGWVMAPELYDVATGTWATLPPPPVTPNTREFVSTALQDGRVLITGGYDIDVVVDTAAILDPIARSWTPIAPLKQGRERHSAVQLADGRVWVGGGSRAATRNRNVNLTPADTLDSVEILDLATGTWSDGPSLPAPMWEPGMAALPDGRMLQFGATGPGFVVGAPVMYDLAAGTRTDLPGPFVPAWPRQVRTLPDGRIWILLQRNVPGKDSRATYRGTHPVLFDPATLTWQEGARLEPTVGPPLFGLVTPLPGVRLLLTGDEAGRAEASARAQVLEPFGPAELSARPAGASGVTIAYPTGWMDVEGDPLGRGMNVPGCAAGQAAPFRSLGTVAGLGQGALRLLVSCADTRTAPVGEATLSAWLQAGATAQMPALAPYASMSSLYASAGPRVFHLAGRDAVVAEYRLTRQATLQLSSLTDQVLPLGQRFALFAHRDRTFLVVASWFGSERIAAELEQALQRFRFD